MIVLWIVIGALISSVVGIFAGILYKTDGASVPNAIAKGFVAFGVAIGISLGIIALLYSAPSNRGPSECGRVASRADVDGSTFLDSFDLVESARQWR